MTELESALAAIDPASLDYQGWTAVGMALKDAGQPASVWDAWSARDAARYHPGECARKWESFRGSDSPVTASSIFALACQRGWRPPEQALDWDETLALSPGWLEADAPAPPRDETPAGQLSAYLKALFQPDEIGRASCRERV